MFRSNAPFWEETQCQLLNVTTEHTRLALRAGGFVCLRVAKRPGAIWVWRLADLSWGVSAQLGLISMGMELVIRWRRCETSTVSKSSTVELLPLLPRSTFGYPSLPLRHCWTARTVSVALLLIVVKVTAKNSSEFHIKAGSDFVVQE